MTKAPTVTITSIEFCKPLREGTNTQDQITNPLVSLQEKGRESKKINYELSFIAFIPEYLLEMLNPDIKIYTPINIQVPKPFVRDEVFLIKNKLYFGWLGYYQIAGDEEKRNHFDIAFTGQDKKDYMLVYCRIQYSVLNPSENWVENISVKYTEPDIGTTVTKRGTKSTATTKDEVDKR